MSHIILNSENMFSDVTLQILKDGLRFLDKLCIFSFEQFSWKYASLYSVRFYQTSLEINFSLVNVCFDGIIY